MRVYPLLFPLFFLLFSNFLFAKPISDFVSRAWIGASGNSNTQLDLQLERDFWEKSSLVVRFRESRLNSSFSQEVFLGLRRTSIPHRLGVYYGGGVTLLAIRETGKIGGPYAEYGVTLKFTEKLLGQLGYALDYAKRDDIQSIRTFYSVSIGYQF